MGDSMDAFWERVASEFRHALHLHPLTADEAERECQQAHDLRLTEDRIDEIVSMVTRSKSVPAHVLADASPHSLAISSQLADAVYALNRSAGEKSPEVQKRLEDIRREELGDSD